MYEIKNVKVEQNITSKCKTASHICDLLQNDLYPIIVDYWIYETDTERHRD